MNKQQHRRVTTTARGSHKQLTSLMEQIANRRERMLQHVLNGGDHKARFIASIAHLDKAIWTMARAIDNLDIDNPLDMPDPPRREAVDAD